MGNCTLAASPTNTSSESGCGAGSAAGMSTAPKSAASPNLAEMAERKMRA